ncbi:MAG: hypothetical protein JWO90_2020 [Solirubrobacterales bacterium]|jgi:hypothetical protein|nr:hypothetical protein [Solirubrobacterales bacterium]
MSVRTGTSTLRASLERVVAQHGDRGFTFRDLLETGSAVHATPGELLDWLARGRAAGTIQELGFDRLGGEERGPLRYRADPTRPG